MSLAAPQALLLLLLVAAAGWYWPGLGLGRPLRLLLIGLLVLYLAGPRIISKSGELELWVLVDRSASNQGPPSDQIGEWQALLERARPAGDRIRWLDYASDPMLRESTADRYAGGVGLTRTAHALETALALHDPAHAARVLLLSDGYSTERLAPLAAPLTQAEMPVDFRLSVLSREDDARVERFELPARVLPGEPVVIQARLVSARPRRLGVVIRRDGAIIHKAQLELSPAGTRLKLADRLSLPGAHRYEIALDGAEDPFPGNDRLERYVEVVGGPRVLLLSAYADAPLAKALAAQRLTVEQPSALGTLTAASLTGVRAVILDGVPASSLPSGFLKALPFFVQEQGGGLLMTGGAHSFGSGGYFQSAIDPLLPVSMELRREHQKLVVAMAVVLDRSCSMSANVDGASTKMDLANDGVARAIDLLGDRDQLSVHAVDSTAHLIVPLGPVGDARSEISALVRQIESGGGGIYVYTGLAEAWRGLSAAKVGQRHIILYADAADAEEPGEYVALVDGLTKTGATLSVIGLGSENDSDAAFLKDVAERGKGRIFFSESAAEIPALFAQETVVVARSAFLKEPVGVRAVGGAWLELAERPIAWMSIVDGYNLSYAKEGASVALSTLDEYEAPLLAFWQKGLGRVVAVSFATGGETSQAVRAWPGYADFSQSLLRWLMGDELPPGASVSAKVLGNELEVELLHDERFDERLLHSPPKLALSPTDAEGVRAIPWQRMGPGRYHSRVALPAGAVVRGAVQLERFAVPFGPLNASGASEWDFDEARITDLRALAAATHGVERIDLSSVWQAERPLRYRDVGRLLLWLVLAVLLAEIGVSRLGLALPELAWSRRRVPAPPSVKIEAEPAPKTDIAAAHAPPEDPDDVRRRRRFQKAKR